MSETLTEEVVQDAADQHVKHLKETSAIDPVEEAAMKFTKLLPYVTKMGSALSSKKGLVRVMHALAEFPLGASKPRLLNESERQLFHILQELQGYKSTVISNILQKNMEMEKLKQTAVSDNTPAEKEVVNESSESNT